MSNLRQKKNLSGRPAMPAFVALSLCASMLAFGCTTDRNLGNGDPVTTPGLRTSPTGSSSPGSESSPTPPPMISSSTYNANQPLAAVQRRSTRLTADEAAAIMAQHQPRVRYLGVVSPGPRRVYESERMAMQQQQQVLPGQYTINSSINSANSNFSPAAITSGVGEVGSDATAVTFVDPNASSGAATVAGGAGTTLTPTTATFGVPAGTFASVSTLTPTAASVFNPPASVSGSTAVANVTSARTAGTGRTSSGVTTTTPVATNGAAAGSTLNTTVTATSISPTSAGVVNPVRVVNSNGRITVTNSGSTTSSSNRQQ